MEFIRGLCNLRAHHRGSVCTIGAFDGVHLGHQQVLRHLRHRARDHGTHSVVLTLEPLPREFFAPTQAPPRICDVREKCSLLREQGVDCLLCVRFNESLSKVPAEDFITSVFVDKLGIRHIVVGDDLRFGHKQRGDFALLMRLGEHHGFTVERMPTWMLDGARASSTRVRKALEQADFALAERLLGRPYSITGKVVHGKHLGSKLGFPTANISLHRYRSALSGVYAVEVFGPGWDKPHPAVANVGVRPTVSDMNKVFLEVHVLDCDENLYHRRLTVRFAHKLRDEQRFESLDALKERIREDVLTARAYFAA